MLPRPNWKKAPPPRRPRCRRPRSPRLRLRRSRWAPASAAALRRRGRTCRSPKAPAWMSSPIRRRSTGCWPPSWRRAPTGGSPRAGRSRPPCGRREPRRRVPDEHRRSRLRDCVRRRVDRGHPARDEPERHSRRPLPGRHAHVGGGRLPVAGRRVPGLGPDPHLRRRDRGPAAVLADAHPGADRSRHPRQPAAGDRRRYRHRRPDRVGRAAAGHVRRQEDRDERDAHGADRHVALPRLRLPFEIVSVLLLAALVGAVVLARKEESE